jgi:hypothetical protein
VHTEGGRLGVAASAESSAIQECLPALTIHRRYPENFSILLM